MAAAQQQGQPDNSSALLWVVGASLVFLAIIWVTFKRQIVDFYFKLNCLRLTY